MPWDATARARSQPCAELPRETLSIEGADTLSVKGREVELRVHGEVLILLKQLSQLPIEDMSFPEASLEDTFMQFYGEVHT